CCPEHCSWRGWHLPSAAVAMAREHFCLTPSTLRALADQEVRPGRANSLDVGRAALLEHEPISRKVAERLAHLDAAGLAIRLHARGCVHRIAPDVVGKAGVADHAGGGRAAMDADAQAKLAAAERRLAGDLIHHGERQ